MKSSTKKSRLGAVDSKTKNVEKCLDECRKLRGLPEELRHRVFYDFGFFLQEMVDYLVWGLQSEDLDIRRFQEKIDATEYDAESFETYVRLFEAFYRRLSREKG
jgi:hypothetical protein